MCSLLLGVENICVVESVLDKISFICGGLVLVCFCACSVKDTRWLCWNMLGFSPMRFVFDSRVGIFNVGLFWTGKLDSRVYRVHKCPYFMEFIFSMSEYESTPKTNGMGCMVKNLTFYFVHEYGGVWLGADCSHGLTHDLLEKDVII